MGKLDIEGAEPLALVGAEKLINRAQPAVWMLELVDHLLRRFGSSVTHVRQWLDERRYDLVLDEPDNQSPGAGPGSLFPLADALASRARAPLRWRHGLRNSQ